MSDVDVRFISNFTPRLEWKTLVLEKINCIFSNPEFRKLAHVDTYARGCYPLIKGKSTVKTSNFSMKEWYLVGTWQRVGLVGADKDLRPRSMVPENHTSSLFGVGVCGCSRYRTECFCIPLRRMSVYARSWVVPRATLAPIKGRVLFVRPAWALSIRWKSGMVKVAVAISLSQGCPPWGGIWRKAAANLRPEGYELQLRLATVGRVCKAR